MTMVTEVVEIVCTRCGERYCDWYRPQLESAAPAACPYCGHDQAADPVLRMNGVWPETPEDEARDR